MPDTITTKPFQSQSQWAWAFATGQPWARRWAHESPGGKGKWFRRLPYKKKSYTLDDLERATLKSDSLPDAIARVAAGIPGLAAFKGEQIAPGITRIRGDLCNVHGKYGSCAEATGGEKPKGAAPSAGKRSPKPKRTPRAGRAAKPKKTDAQQAQERESARAAERQQNRDSVKQRMADADTGLGPTGFDALMAFAEGTQPTGAMGAGLASMGLAEQAADGSYRMTPTGRAAVAAADAGDYQRALDAISRGTDTAGRRQQRTQARAARQTEQERKRQETEQRRAERETARQQRRAASGGDSRSTGGDTRTEAKPAPRPKRAPRSSGGTSSGGSRGGGSRGPSKPTIPPMPKLPKPAQPTASERRQQNRASVKQRMADNDVGLSPSGFDTVMAFADGQQPDPARGDDLVTMGLAEKNADGTYRMTQAARTVVEAASAGDYQRAVDAIARAREAVSKKKESRHLNQSQYAGETMEDWDHDRPYRAPSHVAVERARQQFAQALGVPTVAQKRRVGIRRKAYRGDVSRATVSGRGSSGNPANLSYPLLQSHVAQAPSQTGVARAQSIPRPALAVYKDKAGRYRWVLFSSNAYRDRDQEIVSTKALSEDCDRADADGSYGPLRWWHVPGVDIGDCDFNAMHGRILIESGTFRDERIGVVVARKAGELQVSIGFIHPPDEPDAGGVFHHIRRFERSLVPAGKASNPFTHVLVQEQPTMATMKERLDELTRLLGDSALVAQVLRAAETTQKTVDEQGVAYKSADALTVYTAPDGTQGIIQDGQFIALKAVEVPPVEAKAPMMEMTEGEPPTDDDMGESESDVTLSPGDLQAISDVVVAAIQAHGAALTAKVAELDDTVQRFGYTRQKEASDTAAEIATLKAAIEQGAKDGAALAARLAELEGEQPIATKGYRASADPDTVVSPERLKDLQSDEHPFKDMQAFLMGLSANGAQVPPT